MMAFTAQPRLCAPGRRAAKRHRKAGAVPLKERPNGPDYTGGRAGRLAMSKDELIIQLIKVGLGVLIGGYFLWWSLEVLKRLPPVH
jgi:hypothetical protein